eukprot:Anaeramoba_ignava/a217803_42.p3 GENE.a217803_42~~a217803_42.p3  ORF type:complete len:248 (+),score=71.81 a217803_42:3593-4336(+)
MRHLKRGRKLKRTSSHKKALMKNLATALFEHKRISTTEAKAKELRPYAEKLITKAKHALSNEKQGNLPKGQTIDVHNRRIVGKHIASKAVVQELFDTIAPMIEERPGGYTRIIKTGFRRGDAGRAAIIELVDWAAPQDGASSIRKKKKSTAKPKKSKAPKVEEVIEETVEEIADTKEEVTEEVAAEEVKEETPAEEPKAEEADADEAEEEVKEETAEEEPKAEAPAEEEPKAEEEKKEDSEEEKKAE